MAVLNIKLFASELCSSVPDGTYDGKPQPIGDLALADSISLQEFGSDGTLASNLASIEYVFTGPYSEKLEALPIYVSHSIYEVLQKQRRANRVAEVYQGPSARNFTENTGTYGEAIQLKAMLGRDQLHHPALVTSGFNAGMIYEQGRQLGIDAIIPPDLPRVFDRRSSQLWTKSRVAWMATTQLRIALLRAKHPQDSSLNE